VDASDVAVYNSQLAAGGMPVTTVLKLDEIKPLTDIPQLIREIEAGFVLYSDLELGHVIKNPGIGRTSEDQITVVDLTGVAIQDIQIAKMVDRALREDKEQTRKES